MKSIAKLLLVCFVFTSLTYNCEKITVEDGRIADKENYFPGKIIKHTCGGTVLQLINSNDTIGEPWRNFMVYYGEPVISYPDCVLAGNLQAFLRPDKIFEMEGDTLFLKYYKVDFFKIGGPWCAIGGLPGILIEISDIFNCK